MNFKKTALNATLLATLAASGMANAAGKSQLTVTVDGTIVPASCDIGKGSDSTLVQLGKLSADRLNLKSETMLPVKKVQITIDCPSLTAVAFQPTDRAEKAGQVLFKNVKAPDIFSLGATSSGAVIGGYMVHFDLSSTKVDGANVSNFLSAPAGSNAWTIFDNASNLVSATGQNMYTWARGAKNTAPVLGKTHNIGLEFTPFISPASTLKTSENIYIRGEATYDLVYL